MKIRPIFRYTLLLISCMLAGSVFAQRELMLHQQSNLWHATATNPAFFPKDKRIVIGLPAYGLDAGHSGDITFNDLFRKRGDRYVLDLTDAIDKLDPENDGNYSQRFETVSVGFRIFNNLYFQAGHATRLSAAVTYPKTLAELFWNGNAPYIGQTLDVGISTTTFDWNELNAGLSFRIGNNVSIGARAKYLSGIGAVKTDDAHKNVSVYTDPDIYQLQLNSDYAFHSSGTITAIDTSGFGFELAVNELKNGFSDNSGWAYDLGVQLQLGERLSLSASVLDLGGSISWKKNANYFISQGTFDYDGVIIPGTDILNGTVDSLDFTAALDSLNDVLQFVKTPDEFTTELPTRYYLGGTFKLSNRFSLGAVFFHQNSKRRKVSSVGVNAHFSVLKWLTLGGMYSVNDRSAANIGLSIVATPGPVQLFLVSDNAFNSLTPYGSAAVNFRFGGALVF